MGVPERMKGGLCPRRRRKLEGREKRGFWKGEPGGQEGESGQEGRGDPKGQRARPVRGSRGVKVDGGTPGSVLSLEPLRSLPTHTHVQMTHKRGGTPEDQRVIQRVRASTGG